MNCKTTQRDADTWARENGAYCAVYKGLFSPGKQEEPFQVYLLRNAESLDAGNTGLKVIMANSCGIHRVQDQDIPAIITGLQSRNEHQRGKSLYERLQFHCTQKLNMLERNYAHRLLEAVETDTNAAPVDHQVLYEYLEIAERFRCGLQINEFQDANGKRYKSVAIIR